jgi:microcin C transport system substrate-binding protein
VLRGDAPPRMELCFDSLMAARLDEPDAMYGLVADTVDVSEDGNVFTFHLRPEARFHDGTPLTAEDVAFSLMLLKTDGHPNIAQVIREMVSAEAPMPDTVVVTLSGEQARDTILTIAGLPIFSKAYYDRERLPRGRSPRRSPRDLQGRPAERRAASSSTSGSPTTGPRTCR